MAHETENIVIAGIIQVLVSFFTRTGRPEVAAEITAITGRADLNYQEILDRATQRTTPTD